MRSRGGERTKHASSASVVSSAILSVVLWVWLATIGSASGPSGRAAGLMLPPLHGWGLSRTILRYGYVPVPSTCECVCTVSSWMCLLLCWKRTARRWAGQDPPCSCLLATERHYYLFIAAPARHRSSGHSTSHRDPPRRDNRARCRLDKPVTTVTLLLSSGCVPHTRLIQCHHLKSFSSYQSTVYNLICIIIYPNRGHTTDRYSMRDEIEDLEERIDDLTSFSTGAQVRQDT